MITTLLIYGYLGMIVYIIFDLLEFNKRTMALNAFDTLKHYFNLSNILKIVMGMVLVGVYINISLMVGGEWLIKYVSGNLIDGDTPAEVCLFAFMIGVLNQVVLDKLVNILNKDVRQIEIK
jgi:hypothetical protein